MNCTARTTTRQWLLLSALAFALLCMHSLVTLDPAHMHHEPRLTATASAAATVGEPAMSSAPVMDSACCLDHSPGHAHDMQHLCLAVLVALAALVVGWLLWWLTRTTTGDGSLNSAATRIDRGPPRPCPGDLLSSLCVLRL